MNFCLIISICVIILTILLYYYNKHTEGFDAYSNHYMDAANIIYPNVGLIPENVNDMERKLTYTWAEKDKSGWTIYDEVYLKNLENNSNSVPSYINSPFAATSNFVPTDTIVEMNNGIKSAVFNNKKIYLAQY